MGKRRVSEREDRVRRLVGKAIGDFKMIEDGDRILVAISGGKDSWVLLHILEELQRRAPVRFSLVAVNIDQGFSGFRQDLIEDFVSVRGVEYHMDDMAISDIISEKAPNDLPCSLCSRLRRGRLYTLATQLQCNKVALGHHSDDFIETLLLNAFFVGRLGAMSPKLLSESGEHVVIRPLVYVPEKEIVELAQILQVPIVCCQCPLMCGQSTLTDQNRKFVKNLLSQLETRIPHIRSSLLASLSNVRASHLLDMTLSEALR